MILNNKLIRAIESHYNIIFELEKFQILENDYEWLVSPMKYIILQRENPYSAGGVWEVLVVPKNGTTSFAARYCSIESGVPYFYEIIFLKIDCNKVQLAKFIGVYLDVSPTAIFTKFKENSLGIYEIVQPLVFKKQLEEMGVGVKLIRQNNKGGYF